MKPYQSKIIVKIKQFWEANSPSAGVHWVSSELTFQRALLVPPTNTQSYLNHTVANLNLGKPQVTKMVLSLFFFFSFSFSLLLSSISSAKQYSPYTDQTTPSCFGCSASAPEQNTFWTAQGFPALPACTSPVLGGRRHSFVKRQLKQWQHDIWISNVWPPNVNILFYESRINSIFLTVQKGISDRVNIHTTVCL